MIKRRNGLQFSVWASCPNAILVFLIALSLICDACAAAPRAQVGTNGQVTVIISANDDLKIPDDQIRLIQEKALSGSGEAAHRLAMFYFSVKLDDKSGMYWETIGAENGFPVAMSSLGVRLMIDQKDRESALRARFWLERAKKAGDPTAQSALDELDEQHPSR